MVKKKKVVKIRPKRSNYDYLELAGKNPSRDNPLDNSPTSNLKSEHSANLVNF